MTFEPAYTQAQYIQRQRAFLALKHKRAYPPTHVAPAHSWKKDFTNFDRGIGNQMIPKYVTTIKQATYGNGTYNAWANSVRGLPCGSHEFPASEWPASGAFDHRVCADKSNSGWSTQGQYMNADALTSDVAPFIALALPEPILLLSYHVKARCDKALHQNPKEWKLFGSSDGKEWVLLDSQVDQVDWNKGEERVYEIPTTSPMDSFPMFKLEFHKNNSPTADVVTLGNVTLQGVAASKVHEELQHFNKDLRRAIDEAGLDNYIQQQACQICDASRKLDKNNKKLRNRSRVITGAVILLVIIVLVLLVWFVSRYFKSGNDTLFNLVL